MNRVFTCLKKRDGCGKEFSEDEAIKYPSFDEFQMMYSCPHCGTMYGENEIDDLACVCIGTGLSCVVHNDDLR